MVECFSLIDEHRFSVLALFLVLLVNGCGNSDRTSGSATATTRTHARALPWYLSGGIAPPTLTRHIVVKQLRRHGLVLIDGKGFLLYVFAPDRPGATCSGPCATTWPAFTLQREHVLDSSPALSEELIAVEPKERYPLGSRTVRYGGYLLHSYTGDTTPGVAKGQGAQSYGGHWYVLSSTGKPVTGKL